MSRTINGYKSYVNKFLGLRRDDNILLFLFGTTIKLQKSTHFPSFSQSPYRAGSGPLRPPYSGGFTGAVGVGMGAVGDPAGGIETGFFMI
jgi:hypothetical protein